MAGARPVHKLVDLEVLETSGVDHPAHLQEGWVVIKSADASAVDAAFGSPASGEEGGTVPETDLAKANAKIEELEAALAKSAEKPAEPKSVEYPPEVQAALAKSATDLEELRKAQEADREELRKERELRLDTVAITKSREDYKSIGLDHDVVAPALRKFAAVDAEAAEAIVKVLKAADGQLESAGIFAELGKSGAGSETTAVDQMEAFAKELREKDPTLSASAAFNKALELKPELYKSYVEGK